MDKEKLKKHLMDNEKCSAEEADEKLSKMSDDDKKSLASKVDEDEKKLAAAKEEEEKKLAEKKDEDEKKLSAARTMRTRMSGIVADSVKKLTAVRLGVRKQGIVTQLSRLRAEGKVTPAELKKIDVDKLSARGDEAVSAVIESLNAREPVIHIGRFGSLKSLDVSALAAAGKEARMSQLEEETRANMKLLSKKKKRLADGDPPGNPVPAPQPAAAAKVEQDQVVQVLTEAEAALQNGDTETALKYIQALRVAMAEGVEQPVPAPAQEAAMSALTKQVAELTAALGEMSQIIEAPGA